MPGTSTDFAEMVDAAIAVKNIQPGLLNKLNTQFRSFDPNVRSELFKLLCQRLTERQDADARWDVLATILFELADDSRFEWKKPRTFIFLVSEWTRHQHEAGASKATVLVLQEQDFRLAR